MPSFDQMSAEELLRRVVALATNPEVPAAARLELLKWLERRAFGPPPNP
jgi:hypothetical protein